MKAMLLKTFLLTSVIATAITPAFGQAQHTFKVPFTFQIGKVLYPAGSYSLEADLHGSFVILKNGDNRDLYHWVIVPGKPAPTDEHMVMRFKEFAGNHYLRSVQYGFLVTKRLDQKAHPISSRVTSIN